MIRQEFEDKLVDLVSEYVDNPEDIDLTDNEIIVETGYEDEKREVFIELKFGILIDKQGGV